METIAHIAEHVLEHSLADTLYLIPFLFVTYLAMEWLEHKTGGKTQEAIRHAGAAGPIVGAFLGVVPQCGFSAVAATLYAGRVITLGTLFAVFLSTSDEMLPIFLAEAVPGNTILSIMGAKVVIGMVMGFIVDAVLRLARRDKERLRIHELCEQDPVSYTHLVDSDFDREKAQERLAKLSGGVAVLKVGAATESELKEKKSRIEDALQATRAAVEEGIVAGGGVALVDAIGALDAVKADDKDEEVGIDIIRKAIEAPMRAIAQNAGFEGSVVVEKVKSLPKGEGLNCANGEYGNMIEMGVNDPVKVTRTALQSAASVAALRCV